MSAALSLLAAVAALLALLSAGAYGASDFAGGLAARRASPWVVAAVAQLGELGAFVFAALVLFPGHPHLGTIAWGALAGVGSGGGVLALYKGLAVSAMTVVSALSAVLTAALPVVVGLTLGDHLSLPAAIGIVLALPAIMLVSYQRSAQQRGRARVGVMYGCLAGVGFALLFIALDRAGTHAGAWPLVPSGTVALLFSAPLALRDRTDSHPGHAGVLMGAAAVLGSCGNLLFLAATGHGELATVAVLTALYPALTIVLARVCLDERWNRVQVAGLLAAAGSVVLLTLH